MVFGDTAWISNADTENFGSFFVRSLSADFSILALFFFFLGVPDSLLLLPHLVYLLFSKCHTDCRVDIDLA
jgi:hypothetical protein